LIGHKKGLTLEVTDRCNLKCTYCPKSLDIGVKGSHMDWDIFVKGFEGRIKEGPLDVVNLVGFGEPFLFPHLEKAVRYIKDYDTLIHVRVTSNGTLLNAEWGGKLSRAGLDQITISVNATSAAQYKRINAADLYDRVVKNTTDFLESVNSAHANMTVLIQVLDGVNDEVQIQQFKDFWEDKLGQVGAIQVQPFVNWAGQIDGGEILDKEDQVRLNDNRAVNLDPKKDIQPKNEASPFGHDQRVMQSQAYPCYHLHKTRIISREGNALACCMVYPDTQGGLDIGNLNDKTFKELYGKGKIKHLQKLDKNGELSKVEPCDTCDAWKTVPNIWWRNPLNRWVGPKWM